MDCSDNDEDDLPSTSYTSVKERTGPTPTNERSTAHATNISTTYLDSNIPDHGDIPHRTIGIKKTEKSKAGTFLEISDSDSENDAYQISSASTSCAIPNIITNFTRNNEPFRITPSPESSDSEFLPPAFSNDEPNVSITMKYIETSGISILGKHTLTVATGLGDGESCNVPKDFCGQNNITVDENAFLLEEPVKKKKRSKVEIEEQKREALLKREAKDKEKQVRLVEKKRQKDTKAAEQLQKKFQMEKEKLQKQAKTLTKSTVMLGGCTKFITAYLDPSLLPDSSAEPSESPIIQKLISLGANYRVEPQTWPGSITWKRTSVQHSVLEDELKITSSTTSAEENQVLIVLAAELFAEMVFSFKEVQYTSYQTKQADILGEHKTLVDFTKCVKGCYHGKKVTFILHGLEKYMRNLKTKHQRAFRNAALGTVEEADGNCRRRKKNTTPSVNVTQTDIEEALVDLQFKMNTCVYHCECDEDIAVKVVAFTKAIAEKPLKKSLNDMFAFCLDKLDKSSLKVSKVGHGLVNVWQQQIEQFRNVSRDMAAAIIYEFPSPQLLHQAYQKCGTENEAMHLLDDILVRRGGGSIATSRRIGPELSKRFYIFFHSKDGSELMKQ